MKDGPYLLLLPDTDYGTPVTLKNQTNPDGTVFQLIASVAGVQILSNLDPGFRLFPMLVITPKRIDALKALLANSEHFYYEADDENMNIVRTMLDEIEE